jgi:hypothetical protein
MSNFDSYRAERIHEASLSVDSILKALSTAPAKQHAQIMKDLKAAIAEREAAAALPEHVYDCATCGDQFQSVQRVLIPIPHIITHDAEGTPTFQHTNANRVICPKCFKGGIGERLTGKPRPIEARFLPSTGRPDESIAVAAVKSGVDRKRGKAVDTSKKQQQEPAARKAAKRTRKKAG